MSLTSWFFQNTVQDHYRIFSCRNTIAGRLFPSSLSHYILVFFEILVNTTALPSTKLSHHDRGSRLFGRCQRRWRAQATIRGRHAPHQRWTQGVKDSSPASFHRALPFMGRAVSSFSLLQFHTTEKIFSPSGNQGCLSSDY